MGLIEDYYARLKAYKQANTPRSTRPAVSPANVIDQGLFDGNANRLIQRAKAAPAELNALAGPQMAQQVQQAMNSKIQPNRQQWMDSGMELSGMAPLGGLVAHTVYHGSPHKFDKFDMSKIGTGEGAQAYGHGLYMAESPYVAQSYKTAGVNEPAYVSTARNALSDSVWGTTIQEKASALQSIGEKKASDYLLNNAQQLEASSGSLYKVDIPDESIPRMLDWDKPINQQSPEVIDGLRKSGLFGPKHDFALDDSPAGQLVKELAPEHQVLLKQNGGIPGIRYLDGNSRGAGGTSNFVLFDDQLPRILETNGVPTGAQPWASDAIGLNGKLIDPRGKVRK